MFVPLRIPTLLIALAVALAAAGCGGSTDDATQEVPEGAVAVVGDEEISKADFDRVLAQAKTTFKARKQEFPSTGSPEYEQLKQSIVRSLVEQKQFELGAEELGISVSEEEIDKRLDELKQQFFEGDEKKYKDELKKQGLTEEQVRTDIRSRLLSEKIFEEVTSDVKVSDADVKAHYEQNESQFGTPASRDVRHILVKTKAKAQQLHDQIAAGADFAALAKKNSQDPSSKAQGGKFTAQKGATVPPFDKAAFALKTGELSEPIKTQFGWHIIEATADVQPAKTKPLSAVEEQIRQQLEQEKQNEAMNKWVEDLKKDLDADITYAAGFRPPEEQTTTGQAPGTTDTQ
jgi:parvulin-like peptidyl-prolyl isomerase